MPLPTAGSTSLWPNLEIELKNKTFESGKQEPQRNTEVFNITVINTPITVHPNVNLR